MKWDIVRIWGSEMRDSEVVRMRGGDIVKWWHCKMTKEYGKKKVVKKMVMGVDNDGVRRWG